MNTQDQRGQGGSAGPEVVVVGAGVSGCACAAALAARGVSVTVINSALDSVGQPGYGPVVAAGPQGWNRIVSTLAELPRPLRDAWVDASTVPYPGAPFLFVDRRVLSVGTKRALERMPGLKFRQGLVTDVGLGTGREVRLLSEGCLGGQAGAAGRAETSRGVVVQTVFGEMIEGTAVVLAVGLNLRGRVQVGSDVMSGGRYGETPGDRLQAALGAAGVTFLEAVVDVGSRFSGQEARVWLESAHASDSERTGLVGGRANAEKTKPSRKRQAGARRTSNPEMVLRAGMTSSPETRGVGQGKDRRWTVATIPLRTALERVSQGQREGAGEKWSWPAEYPSAPCWDEELRARVAVLGCEEDGEIAPWLSPDGAATGEFYVGEPGLLAADVEGMRSERTEGEESALGNRPVASRLGHTVTGLVIADVDKVGRLVTASGCVEGVWVTGRAGGAADYLDSLVSGIRVAEAVAEKLKPGSLLQ